MSQTSVLKNEHMLRVQLKHHAMKTYWGREVYVHAFFDLGTRCKSRPLYPQGKSPRYPLDRRVDRPQSRSGRGVEEKNCQPSPGIIRSSSP